MAGQRPAAAGPGLLPRALSLLYSGLYKTLSQLKSSQD